MQFKWNYCGLRMQVDMTFIMSGEYVHSQVTVWIHSDRRIVGQPRKRRRNQQPWGQIKPEEAYTLLPLLLMMIGMSWIVISIDPSCQHLFLQQQQKMFASLAVSCYQGVNSTGFNKVYYTCLRTELQLCVR